MWKVPTSNRNKGGKIASSKTIIVTLLEE